ncbi:hypothetical protein J6590_039960 [Homalodisca vitripennis]|nr:hypothetical protein J6590_039960 [Homalodisca vitripennis]
MVRCCARSYATAEHRGVNQLIVICCDVLCASCWHSLCTHRKPRFVLGVSRVNKRFVTMFNKRAVSWPIHCGRIPPPRRAVIGEYSPIASVSYRLPVPI